MIFKEFRVAILVGAALAVVNGIYMVIRYHDPMLALLVSISLVATILIANADRMCASACRKEAAPGSGHHGGAADHNDRGRMLYHGILSGGNTPVTSCLEKSIKNKKTGRVPAWKLFLFFTLYSVSFSGISHTRSKDIRSARSWTEIIFCPLGDFVIKALGEP